MHVMQPTRRTVHLSTILSDIYTNATTRRIQTNFVGRPGEYKREHYILHWHVKVESDSQTTGQKSWPPSGTTAGREWVADA